MLQAEMPQLTALTIKLPLVQLQQPPASLALLPSLRRLRLDYCGPGSRPEPPADLGLPAGQWLRSLESLTLRADAVAASLGALQDARCLTHLHLTSFKPQQEGHLHLVRWAAQHAPLACVEMEVQSSQLPGGWADELRHAFEQARSVQLWAVGASGSVSRISATLGHPLPS